MGLLIFLNFRKRLVSQCCHADKTKTKSNQANDELGKRAMTDEKRCCRRSRRGKTNSCAAKDTDSCTGDSLNDHCKNQGLLVRNQNTENCRLDDAKYCGECRANGFASGAGISRFDSKRKGNATKHESRDTTHTHNKV